jgi:hypothetical protein
MRLLQPESRGIVEGKAGLVLSLRAPSRKERSDSALQVIHQVKSHPVQASNKVKTYVDGLVSKHACSSGHRGSHSRARRRRFGAEVGEGED